MKRIEEKLKDIKAYLADLNEIAPDSIEIYKKDKTIKAACERYVEKIVEAATDIAFMIIKYKKFQIPEDDIDAFKILFNNKIIDQPLFKKLKEAKGMRNILIHQYGKIDDSIIYNSIKEELGNDIGRFVKEIKKYI